MENHSLRVIEMYESIQGETSLAGCMTSFIRLAGCSLRCSWCDSLFAQSQGTALPLSSIMEKVNTFGWKHVCVTGGEPLLQPNTITLLTMLVTNAYRVSLETNGAHPTDAVPEEVITILDVKCPSSLMSHKNIWGNLHRLRPHDEVKFVIGTREDYEWARSVLETHNLLEGPAKTILFSPVFDRLEAQTLIGWILEDKLPVRVNLQIHKFIWEPTQRGV